MSRGLRLAGVEIAGVLARTTITIRDLATLTVGDIITTDAAASRPALLCVEGEAKFEAEVGQHRGQLALRVVRPLVDQAENDGDLSRSRS